MLRVDSGRLPLNIVQDGKISNHKSDLMVLHGILMTLTFFAVFPGAGLLFMLQIKQAFNIHACTQLVGTGLMATALIIGIRHIAQTHSLVCLLRHLDQH